MNDGRLIAPNHPEFSGFIFKIQANMDPKHRDRIAFVRIVSGKFERDMTVFHVQSGRKVRLSSSHKLFGNERETVDEAYPGDIIGLVGHDGFGIGDTLSTDPKIRFDEIPRFTPEVFEYFHNPNTAKFKQFRQGLDQLLLEGVAQAFNLKDTASRVPLLAAVGPLQFEVLQYRLETEYNAETRRESAPFTAVRWLPEGTPAETLDSLSLPTAAPSDTGLYSVSVTDNSGGSAAAPAVRVTVVAPLQLSPPTVTGTGLAFEFLVIPKRPYWVEESLPESPGTWTPVSSEVSEAGGADPAVVVPLRITIPEPQSGARLYRARAR